MPLLTGLACALGYDNPSKKFLTRRPDLPLQHGMDLNLFAHSLVLLAHQYDAHNNDEHVPGVTQDTRLKRQRFESQKYYVNEYCDACHYSGARGASHSAGAQVRSTRSTQKEERERNRVGYHLVASLSRLHSFLCRVLHWK